MKTVKYELKLEGLESAPGSIGARALSELLAQLTACAERGLRLAIEGQSTKAGPAPKWLENATNLVFTGIRRGSTVLDFDAPVLGETIPDQVIQQDLWGKAPEPNDTAFSYFSRSVRDMGAENLESDYYDRGVLSCILLMKPFVKSRAQVIKVHSRTRTKEDFALDAELMGKVEKLRIQVPEPRAFVFTGRLEQIGFSTKRFHLNLNNGQTVLGRVNEDFVSVEDLRNLWGQKVTVKGVVNFKPSGKVRMLEAQMLKPMEDGEEVFDRMPQVQTEMEFVRDIAAEASRRDWVKDIWGKWPGDETIEELMSELER